MRILMIRNALYVGHCLLFKLIRNFARLVSTPIVVDVFRHANNVFVSTCVVECMTRLVMVFVARASNEQGLQVGDVYAIFRDFPGDFCVMAFRSFRVNVDRCQDKVIACRATPIPKAYPFKGRSTFLMDVYRSLLRLFIRQEVRRIRRQRRTTRYVPRANVNGRVSQRRFAIMKAMVCQFSFHVRFMRTSQRGCQAVRTEMRYARVVNVVIFRLGASRGLIPFLTSFNYGDFRVIFARLFRILFYLLKTSGEEDRSCISHLSTAYERPSSAAYVFVFQFRLAQASITINGYYNGDRQLVRRRCGVVLGILQRSSAILNYMTSSLILFQGRFRVQAIIRDVCRCVEIFALEGDRAGRHHATNQDGFNHSVVVNRVCFVVVQFNGLDFVQRPTHALVLVRRSLSHGERGNGLPMIVGPQTKLIDLLGSPSFVNVVNVDPSVPRLPNLYRPRIRSPERNGDQVYVSNEWDVL